MTYYDHNPSSRYEADFGALEEENISFGGGFTPRQLISNGVISFVLVRVLGASVPGAIAMGIGNILWEAGSLGIPAGWKRWVLGLFGKPPE